MPYNRDCVNQGDLEALADYEAIRLNPQYGDAYNNRGNARACTQGDSMVRLPTTTKQFALIRKDATCLQQSRYCTHHPKGDLDGAIADYNEAIRLNPQYANAYNNRGEAYFAKGDFKHAR